MKYRKTTIFCPKVCVIAGFIVNNRQFCIDHLIGFGLSVYYDVGGNHIVIPKTCGQFSISLGQTSQVFQMLVLSKATSLNGISVSKFLDMPFARAKIMQKRESLLNELHINLLEICTRSLALSLNPRLEIEFQRINQTFCDRNR